MTPAYPHPFRRRPSGCLPGDHFLVLAPHPDDEVLGCGGTIARTIRRGGSVRILFLTDGRHGGEGTVADVIHRREVEAKQAAAVLGVPGSCLHFLRLEDGRLAEQIAPARQAIREILGAHPVDVLLLPYRREYNADHQAAWQTGVASRRLGVALYEYPIWYGPWLWDRLGWRARIAALSHLRDAFRRVKVPIHDVVEIKRRALEAYTSQLHGFASRGSWGSTYLAHFIQPYEVFFADG